MIPQFDNRGLLPDGLYDTSLEEIRAVLGFTERRSKLIDGLEEFLQIWDTSGLTDHYVIDGSFVTSKPEPSDIDMILALKDTAAFSSTLKGLLVTYCYDTASTKDRFGCHAFAAANQAHLEGWIDFFRHEKAAEGTVGRTRGLLRLGLLR